MDFPEFAHAELIETVNLGTLLVGLCFVASVWFSVLALYNLYFHPLAAYPGPLLGRASLLWRIYYTNSGKIHLAIDAEHKKYGDVVRVGPNELSYASVSSWKTIYGHPTAEKPVLMKSEFYDMFGAGFESLCIGSERDPKRHGQMRKNLSSAFSTKALSEQEALVTDVVDRFVDRIGELGGPQTDGLNMTKWYEMVSFDILGEMAFGESFGCIQNAKPHFWSELILEHLYFITLADNLRRLPLVTTLAKWLFPSTLAVQSQNSKYSRQQVARRLERKQGRRDFMTHMISKVESGEMGREELTAHASTLAIAGGETVSTFLAATTFYLLHDPSRLRDLQSEIRTRFQQYSNIDSSSAQQLPYLQAVISEGLRIYPPGSQGFPRLSPGTMIDGRFVPKGTEVYTSAWTVTHDPRNFPNPMAFEPERWLDSNLNNTGRSTDVREASQPFSLGPRGCLGRNFAYMEMSLILAKMLWRYDLELVNEELDWLGESKVHVMWWKPELMVRFMVRKA